MNRTRAVSIVVAILCLQSAFASGPRDRMLASLLSQIPQALAGAPAEPSRVSVYGIECAEPGFDAASFQDQLTTAILDTGRYQVIDRKSLAVLLAEQELILSGLVGDTGEMIQAGKLVGVRGFFFGTLEFAADGAILNLKLVDVESGAIVFSRKIGATDPAFLQLGGGVSYSFVPLDASNDGSVDQVNHAVGFALSYRQGFDAWRWGFVGADLVMYRGFSQDPALVVSCAAVKPKLYALFGAPLGFLLAPYAGASLEMLLLGEDATEPTALAAYPVLGLDINPTRLLCVSLEAGWRLADTLLKAGSGVYLPAGFAFAAGVKLYLNL